MKSFLLVFLLLLQISSAQGHFLPDLNFDIRGYLWSVFGGNSGEPDSPTPSLDASVVAKAASSSINIDSDVITVTILGQSGKIRIHPKIQNTDLNDVTVTMDFIRELSSSGAIVGSSGKSNAAKHSRNTFANTNFAFSSVRPFKDNFGITVGSAVDFTVTLMTSAKLNVSTILFTKNGTLAVGVDEVFNYTAGSLKFNVRVDNWPFCTAGAPSGTDASCASGEVGNALEFGVKILVSNSSQFTTAAANPSGGFQFSVGTNYVVDMSHQAFVDGNWLSLDAKYPAVTSTVVTSSNGTPSVETSLVVGFSRFSSSAFYDPIVTAKFPRPLPLPSTTPSPGCGTRAAKASCTQNKQCKSCLCKSGKCK